MGLLSNRVTRESLKPGDHIYSWRTAYLYAHHGIYVGGDKVIHFTRSGQEVGTGSVLLDCLLVSSALAKGSFESCSTCTEPQEARGVVISCLNCFLAGGVLYRYEYAVSTALFLAKFRGGTCNLAASDEDNVVIHRAKYLLKNGIGRYDILQNNCENFAVYCKTGRVVLKKVTIGQSGQAASIVSGPHVAYRAVDLVGRTSVYVSVATAIGEYCAKRYATDIGIRSDVVKIEVEELTAKLHPKSQ